MSKVLIGPGHREQPIGSASLGYSHQDGRGSYGAGVEHIQGLGTMASGGANYDLYQGKNSRYFIIFFDFILYVNMYNNNIYNILILQILG